MSRPLFWILLAAGAAALLFGLDRLMLWLERRGWIYYRRSKPHSSGTLGNAFLELQQLAEPTVRHVLEERRAEKREEDDAGEPPPPPDDAPPPAGS